MPTETLDAILRSAGIDLHYRFAIEATEDPMFLGFFSPKLTGFTEIGHSVQDRIHQARWGMREHAEPMQQQGLSVPPLNANPTIMVQNDLPRVVA